MRLGIDTSDPFMGNNNQICSCCVQYACCVCVCVCVYCVCACLRRFYHFFLISCYFFVFYVSLVSVSFVFAVIG